jgi:hypothetical protein
MDDFLCGQSVRNSLNSRRAAYLSDLEAVKKGGDHVGLRGGVMLCAGVEQPPFEPDTVA